MSHVTPQTALQLKAAGFPQPKPAIGQHWYSRSQSGGPYLLYIQDGSSPIFAAGQPTPQWLAFAPTAEDILRELGTGWCAIRSEVPNAGLWCCAHLLYGEFSGHCLGQNLAETCAAAYLQQQPQK